MPYIQTYIRDELAAGGAMDAIYYTSTPGQLNYLITMACDSYFKRMGADYQRINDVIGALEGAKMEFYRRIAAPYEDEKMATNGDVY